MAIWIAIRSLKLYDHCDPYSIIGTIYLFVIQQGTHTNYHNISARMLTLTAATLSLLMFSYYTTDITAEMTSGPGDIPVHSFEDVIRHDYKVVAYSGFFSTLLADAKPGAGFNHAQTIYFLIWGHIQTRKKSLKLGTCPVK